jgi:hypothetical protein
MFQQGCFWFLVKTTNFAPLGLAREDQKRTNSQTVFKKSFPRLDPTGANFAEGKIDSFFLGGVFTKIEI